MDPDPTIFIIDLQIPTKENCLLITGTSVLFEGTLTSLSKIKSPKEVTKQ
jgi:hypothetical protein